MTEVRGLHRTELFRGRTLVAVPSNVGPATMPNYPALAAQGIYTDAATGIRVFAGQRGVEVLLMKPPGIGVGLPTENPLCVVTGTDTSCSAAGK